MNIDFLFGVGARAGGRDEGFRTSGDMGTDGG